MEKEAFEKLIADKPASVKIKGVTLYNGFTHALTAYRSEPTSAHLKDWQTAEAALNEFAGLLDEARNSFSDPAQVLNYLKESGWSISKTSLYRHFNQGKFVSRDGLFLKTDIDRYAKIHLKEKATGKRNQDATEELQREKVKKEVQRLEIEIKHKQLLLDRLSKSLISRENIEIELAGRAIILETGLKHWIHTSVMEWIRMVSGNADKENELIYHMTRSLDEHLNGYAKPIDYRIIIDEDGYSGDEDRN